MIDIPTDKDGVPLYGPMADHVNKAGGDAMREQHARFMAEGRLRPEMVKAAVRRAREDAIATWLVQNEGPEKVDQHLQSKQEK